MDYFDKAINDVLDGIERNVVDQVREAASAALEEYPSQGVSEGETAPAGERNFAWNVKAWIHEGRGVTS